MAGRGNSINKAPSILVQVILLLTNLVRGEGKVMRKHLVELCAAVVHRIDHHVDLHAVDVRAVAAQAVLAGEVAADGQRLHQLEPIDFQVRHLAGDGIAHLFERRKLVIHARRVGFIVGVGLKSHVFKIDAYGFSSHTKIENGWDVSPIA